MIFLNQVQLPVESFEVKLHIQISGAEILNDVEGFEEKLNSDPEGEFHVTFSFSRQKALGLRVPSTTTRGPLLDHSPIPGRADQFFSASISSSAENFGTHLFSCCLALRPPKPCLERAYQGLKKTGTESPIFSGKLPCHSLLSPVSGTEL